MTRPENLTSDPVPHAVLEADVGELFDVMHSGGVEGRGGIGIVPLDVAYAICATRETAIKRIFRAKNRSYEKPSGMLANISISQAVHCMADWKHELVAGLVKEDQIPFSVVAPFQSNHRFFSNVEPFVLASSTKAGTLDMLLNAGQFHDEIARQSWQRQIPVFGSSANTSLAGSKYRYLEVEAPVREAADVYFDYGRSVYANEQGRSSTIVDFRDFSVLRVGAEFDRVAAAFKSRGNIELSA